MNCPGFTGEYALLGIVGRRLPGRAVAGDVHRHGVFVVVAAAVAGLGSKLLEITPLDSLQPVGDAMQRRVRRGIVPDAGGRAPGMGPAAVEAGPIALAPEAGEPDAGPRPRPAAHEADGGWS